MFPAWLSRRRDTLKPKQKLARSSLLLPYSNDSHERLDDIEPPAASFAQALSLHKAISKARDSHLEAELAAFLAGRKDPDSRQSFASANVALSSIIKDNVSESSCMLGPRSGCGEPAMLATDSAPPNEKSHSLPSNEHLKVFPRDIRRLVFCLQGGANDIDTEDSTILTPDSIESSFGSESSSVGSSLVRKYGVTREGRQCLLQWSEEVFPFGSEKTEGVVMEAFSAPCYLDPIHSFAEWQEQHLIELAESANCSLKLSNMSIPASTRDQAVESWKHQESSLSYVTERHSFSNSDIQHQHEFCTISRSSQSVSGKWLENSLSPAVSSGPMLQELEGPSSFKDSVGHVGLATSNMELECTFLPGNGNSEGAKIGRILYSKWEESSDLIAANNPSLMLSSQWQEEGNGSCSYVQSNPSHHQESNACQDGEFRFSMSEKQHHSNVPLVSEFEDSCNGLPMCGLQNKGNVECHRSKHEAYIRNGRRHRGSSFSASLPKNLQGVVGDSVALVKMSHSPYEDFRQSMYEMIMEQDLEEAPMDVEELLHCYLTLNSPELHPLIKEVFSDVWSSVLMNVR